ncbi:aminopeptidase N [Providencia stuartii]|uniref:Aminopeptidase N n=1 Tax=Providencia stuartii (strain MRSN 2154) TaxID=1157951 RepID=A0A140NRH9_PROSM|nr:MULTISPECIES: aminopeptidase N [Providencia]AFH95258.1 aminopeptidase N [Providencia stuartii MRSN 2154]MDE8745658.1 aminopeptidase N [Providencia thailandensis]MDE8764333.1 aminopeptidase N [Providencia thailandensis]MDE8776613.1 aminopeptidase N [Providencia thailandensis]MDE8780603.1 aminopeptidase N [Providencia thailandensis]
MTQLRQAKYRQDYQAPDYTISEIDLDFILDPAKTVVTAISQVKRLNPASSTLELHGEDLKLVSIEVDGQPWTDYKEQDGKLILASLPEAFTLRIVNEISPEKNTALEGLYVSGDALCTQCEAEGFRHITYYQDRPDVLARYTTTITADKQRYPYLLSNGNRIAEGTLDDGRHWVKWQDPFPKPSYLFALVAGDFDVLRDTFVTRTGREVALELFVDKGNLDRAPWAMQSLKNAMKWDEDRFGLEYDLDIYMIVAVDFFNMGAMENKGLNVFNSKYVLAKNETATDKDYLNIESVIGHEYFHNWTGNRITCRDWFQLSLKEGLTVFRDQEFSSDLGSRSVNRINNVKVMRAAQFAEDASPMAHPIRPEKVIEMNNFYTLTVYEKGAEVIRMIHTLLGEEMFQAGMQLYIHRHDGSAATCDDFVQAMEDASNVDLSLFRRWYSQSGTPVLTVRDEYFPEKQQYVLHVSQMTPPTADQSEKQPLHIPLDIELYGEDGAVIPLQYLGSSVNAVLNVTQASQTFTFDNVPSRPVPSLLREFSAPVKLDYPYSDEQLAFLMQYASNEFSRWDAAQQLIGNYVKINVANYQAGNALVLPEHVIDAFRAVLLNDTIDPALAALILTLPSENEMAEFFQTIDPDAIHYVANFIAHQLATAMADEFLAVYQSIKIDGYRVDHSDIAKRSLRNVCLQYIAAGDDQALADKLVSEQFKSADNMTDSLAALTAASESQLPCLESLMTAFDERWHHDGLVMDKWFTLQGTSPAPDVLQKVRSLLNHRSFSMSNPNRVRSLVGAFTSGNPSAFHAKDGSGYQFLYEILVDLNTRNPQVASRLIEPLIRLKRFDDKRQGLMRNTLEQLKALDNLSGDLFEKVTKALES